VAKGVWADRLIDVCVLCCNFYRVTAVFQLVGGAVISVLPLPFLPFIPEQTLEHYLSHVFLGITQIPLIVIPLKLRKRKQVSDVKA
jgi:hypothetical protein